MQCQTVILNCLSEKRTIAFLRKGGLHPNAADYTINLKTKEQSMIYSAKH